MVQINVTTAKTPWHVWLVGALGVLWNGYGAYDYSMSQTQGETYLRAAGMNDAQIAYFQALPTWMTGVWAIGVWAGVLGAILLLARSRFALHAFLASLAGLVVSLVHTYGLAGAASRAAGAQTPLLSAVLLAGCLFFIWYTAKVTKQGVLR